jgi:hypothetical protein
MTVYAENFWAQGHSWSFDFSSSNILGDQEVRAASVLQAVSANTTNGFSRCPIRVGELSRDRDFGDLPPSPQRQMEVFTSPFLIAAHGHLRRFYQQETQQRVPLFRDVSQAPSPPARTLQRHQSQIARDLLATLKPIGSADDEHKGQRRQRSHSGQLGNHRRQSVPATPADHIVAGSPTELNGTTPVVLVLRPARAASCNTALR